MGEPFMVRKIVSYLPVSDELRADYAGFAEALLARLRGEGPELVKVAPAIPAWYTNLLAMNSEDSLAGRILRLHAPRQEYEHLADHFTCEGDDFGGYEGERPEWPCRTLGEVMEHFGVTP